MTNLEHQVPNKLILVVGDKPINTETPCLRRDLVARMCKDSIFSKFTYIQLSSDEAPGSLTRFKTEDVLYCGAYPEDGLYELLEGRRVVVLDNPTTKNHHINISSKDIERTLQPLYEELTR